MSMDYQAQLEEGEWMRCTGRDTSFMLVPGGYLVAVAFNNISLVFVPGVPPISWLQYASAYKEVS